jgi:hypothetical protein
MHIAMSCPYCAQKLQVRVELAGKRGCCPGCKKTIAIPVASSLHEAVIPTVKAATIPPSPQLGYVSDTTRAIPSPVALSRAVDESGLDVAGDQLNIDTTRSTYGVTGGAGGMSSYRRNSHVNIWPTIILLPIGLFIVLLVLTIGIDLAAAPQPNLPQSVTISFVGALIGGAASGFVLLIKSSKATRARVKEPIPAYGRYRRRRRLPAMLAGAIILALVFMACAGAVLMFMNATPSISARKARELVVDPGLSTEASLTPVDLHNNLVLVIELRNAYSVERFNNLANDQRYVVADRKRYQFQITRSRSQNGLSGATETIVLGCIVPMDTNSATLWFGADAMPVAISPGTQARINIQ